MLGNISSKSTEKEIQARSNASPSIVTCLYITQPLVLCCTLLIQAPLLSGVISVQWSENGAQELYVLPVLAHSHVSLVPGSVLCDGEQRPSSLCKQEPQSPPWGCSAGVELLSAFWEMVAYSDESLTLSSSFSVHVLLSMPTPQRWVLDFLHPDIHAYFLGMAVFPSLACSCCSYSPGFLTPGEQARGQPGYEWVCEPCCVLTASFAVLLTLLTQGWGVYLWRKTSVLSLIEDAFCPSGWWKEREASGLGMPEDAAAKPFV